MPELLILFSNLNLHNRLDNHPFTTKIEVFCEKINKVQIYKSVQNNLKCIYMKSYPSKYVSIFQTVSHTAELTIFSSFGKVIQQLHNYNVFLQFRFLLNDCLEREAKPGHPMAYFCVQFRAVNSYLSLSVLQI